MYTSTVVLRAGWEIPSSSLNVVQIDHYRSVTLTVYGTKWTYKHSQRYVSKQIQRKRLRTMCASGLLMCHSVMHILKKPWRLGQKWSLMMSQGILWDMLLCLCEYFIFKWVYPIWWCPMYIQQWPMTAEVKTFLLTVSLCTVSPSVAEWYVAFNHGL